MKIQKITSLIVIMAIVIIYIFIVPQTVYSDTVGFFTAKKLNDLGLLYIGNNLSDNELSTVLEQKATKTIAYLSVFGLTGSTSNLNTDFSNDLNSLRFYKSGNVKTYNNTVKAFEYITSTNLTSVDCYRIILEVLGYGSLSSKSNEEVLALAKDVGFGYIQPVVESQSITNGIFSNILFESLYVNGYYTKIPTIHTLSEINPKLFEKAKKLQMIDAFPNTIPLFTKGSFKNASFSEFISKDVVTNITKSEWSALYLNVKKVGYESYKNKLIEIGWISEVEFEKLTDNKKDLCLLLYKIINSKEQYITLVFNEENNTCELWYAY